MSDSTYDPWGDTPEEDGATAVPEYDPWSETVPTVEATPRAEPETAEEPYDPWSTGLDSPDTTISEPVDPWGDTQGGTSPGSYEGLNMDNLHERTDVLEAYTRWRGPDWKTKFSGEETPQDIAEDFKSSMRWIDNNTVAAASALYDVWEAKNSNNHEHIKDLRVLRAAWAAIPAFWQDGGSGWGEGLWSNAWRGALDVTTLLGFGAGKIAGASMTKAIGVAMLTDGTMTGGLNAMHQNINIETNLQKEFNKKEMFFATGMGMAVPATMGTLFHIGGTYKSRAAKKAFDNNTDILAEHSIQAQGFIGRTTQKGVTPESPGTQVLVHAETGEMPTRIRNTETGEYMQNPGGGEAHFRNPESAIERLKITPGVKKTKATTEVPSRQDLIVNKSINVLDSKWSIEPVMFRNAADARSYVKTKGRALASKNINDYWGVTSGKHSNMVAGQLGDIGRKGKFSLGVQRYFNKFLGLESMTKDTDKILRKNLRAKGVEENSAQWNQLVMETPDMVARNAQNSDLISDTFLYYKPIGLIDDANVAGFKHYEIDNGGQSMIGIITKAQASLHSAGIQVSRSVEDELSAYLMAKRVTELAARRGKNKAGNPRSIKSMSPQDLRIAKEIIKTVENNPAKLQAYGTALDELKTFNLHVLEFAKAHGLKSEEGIIDLLGPNLDTFYMPLKRVRNLADGADLDAMGGITHSSDTLSKYLRNYDGPDGDQFISPIVAYMQSVKSIVRSSVDNRNKLKMYERLEALPASMREKYIRELPKSEQFKVSMPNVIKALEKEGVHIDPAQVSKDDIPILTLWARNSVQSNKKNVDVFWRDGKLVEYEVLDPLIADYLHLDPSTATKAGKISTGLANINDTASFLITHDPNFNTGTALVADMTGSWIMSGKMRTKWNAPFINGMYGAFADQTSDDFVRFLINGGGLSGLKSDSAKALKRSNYANKLIEGDAEIAKYAKEMGIRDVDYIMGLNKTEDAAVLRKLFNNAADLTKDYVPGAKQAGRIAQDLADRTENATRYSTYKTELSGGQAVAQSTSEAALNSVDFRLKGSSDKHAMWQRALFPFARAGLNASYQTGRRMFKQEGRGIRLLKMASLPTMMSVAQFGLIQEAGKWDEYDKIPQDTKMTHWAVPLPFEGAGDPWLYMRKPHELAVLSNTAERIFYETRITKEKGMDQVAVLAGSYALHQMNDMLRISEMGSAASVPNPILNTVQAVVSNTRNINGNTVPLTSESHTSGDSSPIPRFQFDRVRDSEMSIQLAKFNGFLSDMFKTDSQAGTVGKSELSPAQIEYVATQFTTSLVGYTNQFVEGIAQPIIDDDHDFVFNWMRLPVFKALFRDVENLLERTSHEDYMFEALRDNKYPIIDADISNYAETQDTKKTKQVLKYFEKDVKAREVRSAMGTYLQNTREMYMEYDKQIMAVAQEHHGKKTKRDALIPLFQARNDELQDRINVFKKAERVMRDSKFDMIKVGQALSSYSVSLDKDVQEKRLVDGPESKALWAALGQKGGGNVHAALISDHETDQYKEGIEKTIRSGDTAHATLTHIADTSNDAGLASLARKLAPHVLDVTTSMRNRGDIHNIAGRYTPSERHIELLDHQLRKKWDNITSGVSEATAVHEALHAALDTKAATQADDSEAWAEVEQVYKELQHRYRDMPRNLRKNIVADGHIADRTLYDNAEHMLIEALTDKKTQDFLKQVPGRKSERRAQMLGGSSLWDGILNYVIKALGLDYTEVTALDSVLTVGDKVLNELDSHVPKPKRKPFR